MEGYARVSAAVPKCNVGNVAENIESILRLWREAENQESAVVVFPEMCLSGYTVRDLFLNSTLLRECREGLLTLASKGHGFRTMAIVGLPLETPLGVFNVAAALQFGCVLGIVPKSFLPNYREFEERRWFRPGTEVPSNSTINIDELHVNVPFGTDLLFYATELPNLTIGVELCEDYWVHSPPNIQQISAGANVICNLSASNFTIGKAEMRRMLAESVSDRGKCAYIYVAAGPGESSTDLAFDSDAFIYENGNLLTESKRFNREEQIITTDIDLNVLQYERRSTNTFGDCCAQNKKRFRSIPFFATSKHDQHGNIQKPLLRSVDPHPFVPKDPKTLSTRCWEVFEIQSNALATRMLATKSENLILGLSGGLDSTQAALVCANVLDLTGKSRNDLICITMPGFGTTENTKSNAKELAKHLGATLLEISIAEMSRVVLSAIGHKAGADSIEELLEIVKEHDITFENVQARMRTLVLMSIANHRGGFVVGTGDLSEKALGWATYAGDHIAMYDVNAGVPKTLIQFVIRWVANERISLWGKPELKDVLYSILDTPISPELLPPNEDKIAQITEDVIGPYELHDFFLYHFVRHGREPKQIFELAKIAFERKHSHQDINKWLCYFLKRFFRQQFKRSCTADAPKVGMVALSPRGDWRMPSDAQVDIWLKQLGDK